MGERADKPAAKAPAKRRRRSVALHVIVALIGAAVLGSLVAIGILAATGSGGTPIGDILANPDRGGEPVAVAGTVEEIQAAAAGNMVWYKLKDSSGAIWVNATIEGKSGLSEVGLLSGGRLWVPLPEPMPSVGDVRRVSALVVSAAPPEGAPANASPYLFPAKPFEEQ
jgi:hypothetical protein